MLLSFHFDSLLWSTSITTCKASIHKPHRLVLKISNCWATIGTDAAAYCGGRVPRSPPNSPPRPRPPNAEGRTRNRLSASTIHTAWSLSLGLTARFVRQTLLLHTSWRCTKSTPCKLPEPEAIFGLLQKALHLLPATVSRTHFGTSYAQYCLGKSDHLSCRRLADDWLVACSDL